MHEVPVLHTPRLTLRAFQPSDAASVQRLAGDHAVADTTLNIPHPYLDGMAERWIDTHGPLWREGRSAVFAMVHTADASLIGAIGLRIEPGHERAELGYWVGRPFWNLGFATEAARAVVGFAFRTLRLARVHAAHLTRNPASGRVLRKVGLRPEGCLRRHVKKWDAFEDLAVYGLLREEFEADADA